MPTQGFWDQSADMYLAFQYGQDAAKGDYPAIEAEFLQVFADDEQALERFRAGVAQVRQKMKQ